MAEDRAALSFVFVAAICAKSSAVRRAFLAELIVEQMSLTLAVFRMSRASQKQKLQENDNDEETQRVFFKYDQEMFPITGILAGVEPEIDHRRE